MKRSLMLVAMTLVVGACASARTPTVGADPAGSDPTAWRGDHRLYRLLTPYPITAAVQDSIVAYAQDHPHAINYLLAEAAEDPDAPVPVRVNALFLLAQRRADTHVRVFRNALDAEDVRVRATAVAAMREFVTTHPREATNIARMALSDPEPEVQAQALQVLGDGDVDILRAYIERGPEPELRRIAADLIRLAEQRGAALLPDTAGVLRRETASGFALTFMPERYWPRWNAGYGRVSIARDGKVLHTIDGVEAVGGVIPVFLSPDARHVVYERDRTIVVRRMEDGAERVVGAGVAPRVRPFTDEFIYLREHADSAKEMREKTQLAYDVIAMPFDPPAGVAPRVIGATKAVVGFGANGAYSPVRWMKVEERTGTFYLTAPEMELVPLPDPFG